MSVHDTLASIGTQIASEVTRLALPQLQPIPLRKDLERDPDGQLSRIVEYPAVDALELAREVGAAVGVQWVREALEGLEK